MDVGSKIYEFNYSFDIQKSPVNDNLYIYGVASTQDTDRDGDKVSMKSLEKAFHRFMQTSPVLMYNHNGGAMAVGKIIPEFTGEDGTVYKSGIINNELRIVGQMSQASSATDVRIQVEEGILKSFSIGGRARAVRKGGSRCLMIGDLREISIVPVPANDNAMFSVIKSACVGDKCPTHNNTEVIDMEKEEIVEIITKTISEMKAADDLIALQKKYDALMETHTKSDVDIVDLKKKYDALKASKEGEDGGEEDPQEKVIKGMMDRIESLKTDIESMKTTSVKKGIQDGEGIKVEKGLDITSAIMARHYGV